MKYLWHSYNNEPMRKALEAIDFNMGHGPWIAGSRR
jgi:hypothetical protein